MQLRMIKSKEEIALIKAGAAVADVGGAAARAEIAPGVPEYQVALASTAAMVREIATRYPGGESRGGVRMPHSSRHPPTHQPR